MDTSLEKRFSKKWFEKAFGCRGKGSIFGVRLAFQVKVSRDDLNIKRGICESVYREKIFQNNECIRMSRKPTIMLGCD